MPRRFRSAPLPALAAVAAVVAVATAVPASAAQVRVTAPKGRASSAQDIWNHRLRVSGWAYDKAHPTRSVTVRVYADGHYVGTARADRPSPAADRQEHIGGRHAFTLTVTRRSTVRTVVIRSTGASTAAALRTLDSSRTSHHQPAAGSRIVGVAKRYVGKARYVEGGASPRTGFDCSGYTQYVYAQAKVARLPHDADGQRHVRGMTVVSAARAKPGDLVFYFSGGPAYHVAIYAGHGMQYAAATPRDGIRYQQVWSSSVEYRHYS